MTTPSPADGLRECLALLEKATPGEAVACMRKDESVYASIGDHTKGAHAQGDVYLPYDDVAAMAIAVNFLRTHGPALLAALRLREWRPIAEAPKDGTDILASGVNFGQLDQGQHTCFAYWNDTCWMASEGGEFTEHAYLTHWMPLPAPPTADDLARILEGGE